MKTSVLCFTLGLCACAAGNADEQTSAPTNPERSAPADTTLQAPSRPAYEGFRWDTLSGAGLKLWAQANENIRLLIDPSLPGIVQVRDGDPSPCPKVRIFDLENNRIDDVLRYLENTPQWDKEQTCRFQPIESKRPGVRRYHLVPTGEYARQVKRQIEQSPVPSTCNGWGTGNSGQRYFEIHENRPDKALFVEIGQDAPLFDENSLAFTAQADSSLSTDLLYTLTGEVRIGHEVRSFRPDGSPEEFWIVDKTGTLTARYDRATQGQKNGKPARATLKVEYNGKWDEGFAAEYDGVFLVREVLSVE